MSESPMPVMLPTYTERKTCRLCGSKDVMSLLNFGMQYLVGFLKETNRDWPQAPLDWMYCMDCHLLQLRHQVQGDLLWREYWYRSGVNKTMNDALQSVVRDGLQYHDEGAWLDIGANDGTLLSKVPREFAKIGVEPAFNLKPFCQEHADEVYSDYFTADLFVKPAFQVITSCAMFYDLENPHTFIEDIKSCLAPDGVWINQISDTAQMLKVNAFDNICHEHCCYYDVETITRLYNQHGLTVISYKLNDVNGGSLRVAAMKKKVSGCTTIGIPAVSEKDLTRFAQRVTRWKALMQQLLDGMEKEGAIWLYGASTKAAMWLQYLDESDKFIAAAERNPNKHGLVMAGTWIPITGEVELRQAKPAYAVVGPWAFRKEMLERETELRAGGTTLLFPLPHPEFAL